MKYDSKTGRFDLSDLCNKRDVEYNFSIKNFVQGFGWLVNVVEGDLRAFCSMRGLRIEIYKSGWIFKHMTFVIKGCGTESHIIDLKKDLIDLLSSYVQ